MLTSSNYKNNVGINTTNGELYILKPFVDRDDDRRRRRRSADSQRLPSNEVFPIDDEIEHATADDEDDVEDDDGDDSSLTTELKEQLAKAGYPGEHHRWTREATARENDPVMLIIMASSGKENSKSDVAVVQLNVDYNCPGETMAFSLITHYNWYRLFSSFLHLVFFFRLSFVKVSRFYLTIFHYSIIYISMFLSVYHSGFSPSFMPLSRIRFHVVIHLSLPFLFPSGCAPLVSGLGNGSGIGGYGHVITPTVIVIAVLAAVAVAFLLFFLIKRSRKKGIGHEANVFSWNHEYACPI